MRAMVQHEPPTSDAASASVESSPDADLPGDSTPPADLDAVFAALDHPRRRYLLSALTERDGGQSLTRLATDIVAWENDEPREDVCPETRRRCRVALHHVHVPKLAALDVVDYDRDGDPTVRAAGTGSVTAVFDSADAALGTELETLTERDGA